MLSLSGLAVPRRGLLLLPLVLGVGCAGGSFKGRAPGGGDTCGQNSEMLGGDCECVDAYEWCDDTSLDCCAYATTEFEIIVWSFGVFPYKDPSTVSPWDWDGDIPDELITLLDLIGYVEPSAKTFAEVLEIVDETAPVLLEGTVPPDPMLDFYQGSDYLDYMDLPDDTYEVSPGSLHQLDLARGEWAMEVWDEDIVDDDYVGAMVITVDDAQQLAGTTSVWSSSTIWELELEVQPVW